MSLEDDLDVYTRAETGRLAARFELLDQRPRKAQKAIDDAIAALGEAGAPVEVARCTEARGLVLLSREQPDARGIIEQAHHLYEACGCAYPLVLEGWPVPRAFAKLKED